jgi:hypothetical protein
MRYKVIVRVREEALREFHISTPLTLEQFSGNIQASLSANKYFTFMCDQKPNEVFFGKSDDIVFIHILAMPEPEHNSVNAPAPEKTKTRRKA